MTDSRIYLPNHADQARRQAARRVNGTMPPSQWERRDAERAEADQARADAYSDGEAEDIAHDDAERRARIDDARLAEGRAWRRIDAATTRTDTEGN